MDFVILKVNGKDVSNSSHEDAVRCFESAQEPIIVEVLRRQPAAGLHQMVQSQSSKDVVDRSSNSMDMEFHEKPEKGDEAEAVKEVSSNPANSPLVSTAVQTDWAGLIEEELMLDPLNIEEQPCNDSFEEFLPQHINFEEVTLRKSGSAEKLGLTVCYSSGSGSEDADTEVYISEIVPESLAARDGRLREGDQILRVNGKDVANKEQTECLFAETKNAVTLLVSRCFFQDEEYDERRLYQQDSPSSSPDNNPAYQNSMIEQLIRQQQESDDPAAKETDSKTQNTSKIASPPPPVPSHTSEDRKQQWIQDGIKECSKKIDLLNLRPQQPGPAPPIPPIRLLEADTISHVWSDTEHIYETILESDSEPIYSSPYEHQHWIQNHQNIGTTTNTITGTTNNKTQNTSIDQSKPWNWSSKSNSSGEEKESSSAYNTGESCHSNPLTLELHQGEKDHHKSTLVLCPPPQQQQQQQQQQQHKSLAQQQQQQQQQTKSNVMIGNLSNSGTTVVTGCSCPLGSTTQYGGKVTRTQPSSRKSSHQLHRENHCVRDVITNASTLPADTMYTNAANLQQTILLQQELFKQALMTRRNSTTTNIRESSGGGTRKSKSHGNFQAPNLTRYQFVGSQQVCTSTWVPPEDKCEVQMEWKVKRRPDGTRYIARRPVRNRILRNRAIKISEERAGQTTEDDTMSEMKVGRYWSKEERKRQLERARERKQRHQEIQQPQQPQQQQPQQPQQQQQQQQQLPQLQTNDITIGDYNDDKIVKKPLNIVELSQKKMARKKTTMDDFTTVQEMLVHGNRVGGGSGPGTGGKLMGLLSVTTV